MTARSKLVPAIAERLRALVFAGEAGDRIGALGELARGLGVGIVTIQQAARVLEHEGLLEVRRGPGGGYYGRRPDAASLERALASYMRTRPGSFAEALDMTSLLFTELCAAAARCDDIALREELRRWAAGLDRVAGRDALGLAEGQLQELLFRMVDRPIFEMLTRVTLRFASADGGAMLHEGEGGVARWAAGRTRIVGAILAGDGALARFEADRSNRAVVLAALGYSSRNLE